MRQPTENLSLSHFTRRNLECNEAVADLRLLRQKNATECTAAEFVENSKAGESVPNPRPIDRLFVRCKTGLT